VPPDGSRFWSPAVFSRDNASSASSRVPRMVREGRRRRPVTASRGSSMSTFQMPSPSWITPPLPRWRRRRDDLVFRLFEGFPGPATGSIVERVSSLREEGEAPVTSETASTRDFDGAEDGIRTRDPHLGKVMRYHCATSAWANTLSRRPPPEQKGQSGRPRPRVALLRRRPPTLKFGETPVSLNSTACARTRTPQS
jgi:hypothetical protein